MGERFKIQPVFSDIGKMETRKNLKTLVVILILALLLENLLLIFVYSKITGAVVKEDETINIGAILPLSGATAKYGERSKLGIELAIQEIKQQYPDFDFQIYYEDSIYDPKEAVNAYNKLKNINNIDAVITSASHVSLAIQPISNKDNTFQMAIFSSAGTYTTPNDLSFRVTAKSEIESRTLADFIKDKNYKKLAILYLDNDFGIGFKDSIKNTLKQNKAKTKVVSEQAFLLDTKEFRTPLIKLKQYNPDAIFIVGTAKHYALVLKQAEELGIKAQFITMHSAEDSTLTETAGDLANGLVYSYPFDSTTKNQLPDTYAAQGYEGFKLTTLAFIECGKDNECVKNYLENTEFNSVFGPLSFDENGDVYYDFFLKTVRNGEFVRLE